MTASNMGQWTNALVTKPDNLSLSPRFLCEDGENQLFTKLPFDLHSTDTVSLTHHTYTHNYNFKTSRVVIAQNFTPSSPEAKAGE